MTNRGRYQDKRDFVIHWLLEFQWSTPRILSQALGLKRSNQSRFFQGIQRGRLVQTVKSPFIYEHLYYLGREGKALAHCLSEKAESYAVTKTSVVSGLNIHHLSVQQAVLTRSTLTLPFDFQSEWHLDLPATARPDAIVTTGNTMTVELNGSGSTDAEGDPLRFVWSLERQPVGSTAALTTPTGVVPTLTIDQPGDYVVHLLVHDGTAASAPDTVTLSTGNVAPVAEAGPDQTIAVTQPAFLDGRGSRDANGDALTYRWAFRSQPAGSSATLDDAASATPSFLVTQAGTYTVTLSVSDGLLRSEADVVVIATGNSAPVAHAGPDQSVRPGTTVTVDGRGSRDADGQALTYHWAQTVSPPGNTARLRDPKAAAPTFTPAVAGEYVAQLQVHDGTVRSAPDTALIRVGNTAPTAEAGPDQRVPLPTTVQLDGTSSRDPQGDALTFQWTLTPPTGSGATLSDATIAQPTFVPDVEGPYTATLLVHDGDLASAPDTVRILVSGGATGPPTLSGFQPSSGPIGTVVTLTGRGFAPVLSDNQVRLNGRRLVLSNGTATALTGTLPSGATTGLLTVTTPRGTATSATAFTVTPRTPFTLQATPPQATTIQGGAARYALTLTTQGDFTNFVTLSLATVPAQLTAHFSSPAISAQQTVFLTLSSTSTTPVGILPVTVVGRTTLETGGTTATLPITLQVVAGAGQTHVSGQFLTAETEAPLPNIIVNIGAKQVTTDAAGRFLLQHVPAGKQKLMASGTLPEGPFAYSMDLQLVKGQAHELPPFYRTAAPPLAQFTPFRNATQAQTITDARYPGLSYMLPAGVRIIGWDQQPKTGLAFERLPIDRLGVPPPPKATHAVYKPFFRTAAGVSAMGGRVTPPGAVIPFSLPNDLGLPPGAQAELWVYDASPIELTAPSGWKLAGMGTVSADGTQIDSNPGVGISRFCQECGTAYCTCAGNPQCEDPNKNPEGDEDGDPVDLGTGTFTADAVDLTLPGLLPIRFGRTFNAQDTFRLGSGVFRPGQGLTLSLGKGWVSTYDIALVPRGAVRVLVLPGNMRLDLTPQANGTWTNATHRLLLGAVLRQVSSTKRELRFKDGRRWTFQVAHTFGDGSTVDLLAAQQDRNGNRVTIDRNGVRITRIVGPSGRALEVTSTFQGISEVRDPLGRTVAYQYDRSGRLATVTNPAGGTTQYTYDRQGHLLTITDARGITYITNSYGASGRVLRQVLADKGEWQFRYHLQGASVTGPGCPGLLCPTLESWANVHAGYTFTGGTICATTVVDPNGQTTTTRFNNRGYTIGQTDGVGQTGTVARGADNVVTARTDVLGRVTRYAYDALGNVTSITDADGQVTRLEYEPTFSQVTTITDALKQSTTFTYDTQGNLLTITDPLKQTTTFTYNRMGQPVTSTNPLGHTTTLTYDQHGNMLTTTNPLGQVSRREYDESSRLIRLTDQRGFVTQYQYDPLNHLTQMTDARRGVTRFTYDPNGNLLTLTDAKNQTTTFTYDPMDRLASRQDALGRQETSQYDLAGNLKIFTDRKGQATRFTYDARHRRTGVTYADGRTTSFVFDTQGRLVRAADAATGALAFVYDAFDRVVQETTPQGTVGYRYDAVGRRMQMTVNGQPPITYQYDAASRLTRVEQGTVFAGLTYDASGRRKTLAYSNGTTTSYEYDRASRLTNLTHHGPTGLLEALSYTYDAAGNRVSLIRTNGTASLRPNAVPTATYDAANQQIQFDGATLTSDQNGNVLTDGTNTYTWDARNRLVGITGSTRASFVYDVLGRRVQKTINGTTTSYVYDGADIVQELGDGATTASYLRSLNIDEPFVRQGRVDEFYHVDALGSPVALSNAAGAITTTYGYEPYGKTTVTGSSANRVQFTGRENDGTGLYFYRARYYDPDLGRFLSEDPIGFGGGDGNFYRYVLGNPINFIDPFGLAYFAKRPFGGLPEWLARGPGSNPIDDALNTELVHEQIFFEDGNLPTNQGFFGDEGAINEPGTVRADDPSNLDKYWRSDPQTYDDGLLREAVENVGAGNYCLLGSNCQDWADKVRREYERLDNERNQPCN